MIGKFFLLTLLVAASCDTSVTETATMADYGIAIVNFIQAFKNMMACGIAEQKIPAMAPLILESEAYTYVSRQFTSAINGSNISFTGLNDFQIINTNFDDKTMRSLIDIMWPKVQILGSYELDFVFFFGRESIPMHQNVLINNQLLDVRIVIEHTFAQDRNKSNALSITDLRVQYLIGDIKAENWEMDGDIALNDYMNGFLSSFSLLLSKEIQPFFTELMGNFGRRLINIFIEGLNLTDLISIYNLHAEQLNNIDCTVEA